MKTKSILIISFVLSFWLAHFTMAAPQPKRMIRVTKVTAKMNNNADQPYAASVKKFEYNRPGKSHDVNAEVPYNDRPPVEVWSGSEDFNDVLNEPLTVEVTLSVRGAEGSWPQTRRLGFIVPADVTGPVLGTTLTVPFQLRVGGLDKTVEVNFTYDIYLK